jgi:cholesterol transport system auxiliary component
MMRDATMAHWLRGLVSLGAVWLALLSWGCGKPPVMANKYLLEYPSPAVQGQPLPVAVTVARFAVAQTYNSTAMVYRPNPYQSETYNYNRWRVNPGYLVTDYLVRDFRNSRLFKAVFGPDSANKSRYVLEGGVAEIQEVDEADGWKAALALNVTLLDLSQPEITKRVVFQRDYRAAEPLLEQTPKSLAQGMSRAMEKLSARIITDTYQAVRGAGK